MHFSAFPVSRSIRLSFDLVLLLAGLSGGWETFPKDSRQVISKYSVEALGGSCSETEETLRVRARDLGVGSRRGGDKSAALCRGKQSEKQTRRAQLNSTHWGQRGPAAGPRGQTTWTKMIGAHERAPAKLLDSPEPRFPRLKAGTFVLIFNSERAFQREVSSCQPLSFLTPVRAVEGRGVWGQPGLIPRLRSCRSLCLESPCFTSQRLVKRLRGTFSCPGALLH